MTEHLNSMTREQLLDLNKDALLDHANDELGLDLPKSTNKPDVVDAILEHREANAGLPAPPSDEVAPIDARRADAGPVVGDADPDARPPDEPPPSGDPALPETVPGDAYSLQQLRDSAETLLGEPGFLVDAALTVAAGERTHLTIAEARDLVDTFKGHETEVA